MSGLSQTEGGQVHRSLDEWNTFAVQNGHKDMKALLAYRYNSLKESTIKISGWFAAMGATISPLRIRQLMRRYKIKRRPANTPHYPPAFWKGVDWSQSDQVIADSKNVDPMTVRRWRSKLSK